MSCSQVSLLYFSALLDFFLPHLVTRHLGILCNIHITILIHLVIAQVWLESPGWVTHPELSLCTQMYTHHTQGGRAPVTARGHSAVSKHFQESWSHSMTSLSEPQEQGLSSPHLADTFPGVLVFTGFCPSFPKKQVLPSANSEAHDSLIALSKCLLMFCTTGYEQQNCFSTKIVSF